MTLQLYTDQQSRFSRAFSNGATCCDVFCACGRVYFVTSSGHGDYEPGELDRLREQAEKEPDNYVEVHDFSSVDYVRFGNRQLVVGCACGETDRYAEWLDANSEPISAYLSALFKERIEAAKTKLNYAETAARELADTKAEAEHLEAGWRPMASAPFNAKTVEVKLADGSIHAAHWACDESGEEQPPFRGWFRKLGTGGPYEQIADPIAWRPKA